MPPEISPRDDEPQTRAEYEAWERDNDPREHEPDCTCTRTDVDQYDARGCEFHDPQSDWRKACAARDRAERVPTIAPVHQNLGDIGCSDDDAPF